MQKLLMYVIEVGHYGLLVNKLVLQLQSAGFCLVFYVHINYFYCTLFYDRYTVHMLSDKFSPSNK